MGLKQLRTEKVVGKGLTLAQWGMAGFILDRLAGLLLIYLRDRSLKQQCSNSKPHPEAAGTRRALAGFSLTLVLAAGMAGLLLYHGLVPWPFRGADSIPGTWGRIPIYAPVLMFALISLLWLRQAGLPIREWFSWKQVTPLFFTGLAAGIGYSLYLFYTSPFPMKSPGFIPPALVMGLMNAVSEEIVFRLIFMQLLAAAFGSRPRANLIQAAIYALPHLVIGGPLFFLLAAGFGLLLGRITLSAGSILPAVICHFLIDIGAIGLPLLINIG